MLSKIGRIQSFAQILFTYLKCLENGYNPQFEKDNFKTIEKIVNILL